MNNKEFPPCIVHYIPPEEPLTQELVRDYNRGRKQFAKKSVNLKEVFESIQDVLYRYIDAEALGKPLSPDEFRWDMYEVLGIPDQSYVTYNQYSVSPASKDFIVIFPRIFQRFNADPKIQNAFTFPDQGGHLEYDVMNLFQLSWGLIVKTTSEERNFFGKPAASEFSMTYGQDEAYKLHLSPKHPYILYTMCRLFSIAKRHPIFYEKYIKMKIVFSLRSHKPRDDNTYTLQIGGGAIPAIVFYCNDDIAAVKEIIEILLINFESEVDTIGAMTPDYRYRVLPFNVRLNSLLFYALGDRTNKVKAREAFDSIYKRAKGSQTAEFYRKRFMMPTWVEFMMAKCSSRQSKQVGDLSMRFLGKNICLPEVQAMLREPNCLDDICWLSPFKDMLSPLTLRGLGIDESKGDDEEADTTANNLVVNKDPENPSPPVSVSRRANLTFHPNMNNNTNNFGSPSFTFPSISTFLPGFLRAKEGGRRSTKRNRRQTFKQTRRFRGGFRFSVKFSGKEAANNLRLRNETLNTPSLSWSASPKDMYTVIMWDPDAPNPSFVHWMVTNIPGSQILAGSLLVPYQHPNPPSGTHRYYVTLFKQSAPVSIGSVSRSGFSLDTFVRNYGLNKVAEKMIQVSAGKN